jgi:hypothetical protein
MALKEHAVSRSNGTALVGWLVARRFKVYVLEDDFKLLYCQWLNKYQHMCKMKTNSTEVARR